ncbi:MAG: hypothetical protein ABJD53_04235 [Gammaproteobacteria bacterium]
MLAALVVFAIYHRFRRNFGRQPLRPKRMTFRIVLLMVVGCSLLPMALRSAQFFGAEVVGAVLGIAMAVWGAERTRFQVYEGRLHYVPHTYTGIAVSLLFLGRLLFRFIQMYTGTGTHPQAALGAPAASMAHPAQAFVPAAMVRSPLTLGIFFVLVCYYVCYYSLLLWKSKHISSEDIQGTAPAAP